MAANYAQLEKMLLARYKCTSVDVAERIYKGRTDIIDVIRSIADMKQCKELFEKHKNLEEIRDGEEYKSSIGSGGAIDLLKRVVANWIQQDLFIRSLNKAGINCELGKFHRDRDFKGCLTVEPTAILWAGERMKSKHRLIDIQIVYGTSMDDGYVTLKKDKYLKLIEKKVILLTMNMTTLKYNLIDFYTNDTVSEEFVMGNGLHVIKVAMNESKTSLNELGIVNEHITNVIANTIGKDAVKVEPQANFIALCEMKDGGKTKTVVKTYSIPEDAAEKKGKTEYTTPKAEEVKMEEQKVEVKKEEQKSEVKAVETKPQTPPPQPKPQPTQTAPKPQPKPQTPPTAPKPTPKPQPKPQPKPMPKPQPKPVDVQEEEDNGGYDFSALDSFA